MLFIKAWKIYIVLSSLADLKSSVMSCLADLYYSVLSCWLIVLCLVLSCLAWPCYCQNHKIFKKVKMWGGFQLKKIFFCFELFEFFFENFFEFFFWNFLKYFWKCLKKIFEIFFSTFLQGSNLAKEKKFHYRLLLQHCCDSIQQYRLLSFTFVYCCIGKSNCRIWSILDMVK